MNNKKEEFNDDSPIIPLYYDRAFKLIFNKSKEVLTKLLSDVLDYEVKDDAEIIIGKEALGKHIKGKYFIHDIVIKVNDTNYVCLELNANKYAYNINRNLYYIFDLLLSLLSIGMKIEDLDEYKVILLNLNMFSNICNKLIEEIGLFSKESNIKVSDIIKIINFDIAKCRKIRYNNNKEKDNLVIWGSIFSAKTVNELSYLLGDDILTMEEKNRFLDNVRMANQNEEIISLWRSETNERLKQESIERGYREEGKEEIIKNMLSEKLDYEIISKVTGKTIEEIKEIESNM